jgi:hypothetical protein
MVWYGTAARIAVAIACVTLTGGGRGCHAIGVVGRCICGAHATGRAWPEADGKIVLCMPAVKLPIVLARVAYQLPIVQRAGFGAGGIRVSVVNVAPVGPAIMPVFEAFEGCWWAHRRCAGGGLLIARLLIPPPAGTIAARQTARMVARSVLLLCVDGWVRLLLQGHAVLLHCVDLALEQSNR